MAKITINPDDCLKVSTAAAIKGIERQAIYYHIDQGNLTLLEIDGVKFVLRSEIDSLKPRGNKGNKKKQKSDSTDTMRQKGVRPIPSSTTENLFFWD